VVFAVPVAREELQLSLVLHLPLKHLKSICLFKFQHVDLEEHFPEGDKALEGGKQFKEVNCTQVNLLFILLFSPEVSSQLSIPLCVHSALAGWERLLKHPELQPQRVPGELRSLTARGCRGGDMESEDPEQNTT